jgi:toxin-antitoxin system PIN domain toxin
MKKTSSDLLFLDVNALLAIAWPNHQFHSAVLRRMSVRGQLRGQQWATCALTELGFLRLSCNPAAVSNHKTAAEAASLLALLVADPLHVYFGSLPTVCGRGARPLFDKIMGHKQITDAYLLEIARRNNAIFLTFDRRLQALAGARVQIEILTG